MAGNTAVEQHDAPVRDIDVTADLKRRAREGRAQLRWIVVIARNAIDRLLEALEHACEVRVALGLVVDNISAADERIDVLVCRGVIQYTLQGGQRLHAPQTPLGTGEQVRIGEQQQSDVVIHEGMVLAVQCSSE